MLESTGQIGLALVHGRDTGKSVKMVAPPVKPAKTSSAVDTLREPPSEVDALLTQILSARRKHDTYSERAFNDWLEDKAMALGKEHGAFTTRMTTMRQVVCTVPTGKAQPSKVLFSCHVDTQDHKALPPLGTTLPYIVSQPIMYDANFGHIMLDHGKPDAGGCLGADDGIGVWIMLKMIEVGTPGTYVFHRGEEVGGLGAEAFVRECRDFLAAHTQAVAFDRPRCDEVIIDQGGQVCASLKYGDALAAALNEFDDGFNFKSSTRGVFTDVKLYRGLIAECVNIGVGYEGHHGVHEWQDYGHALALKEAAIKLDWDALPVERDPKASVGYNGSRRSQYGGYTGAGYGGHGYVGGAFGVGMDDDDDDWTYVNGRWARVSSVGKPASKPVSKPASKSSVAEPDLVEELMDMTRREIRTAVQADTEQATDWLIAMAAKIKGLQANVDALNKLLGV